MNKCAICGREFDATEPLVLFSAPKTHTDYYACSSCEQQINRVLESKDPNEYRKALNYIYTFAAETQNHDVKAYLTEFLENNADHEILKKLVVMNGPDLVMGKLKTKDYYQTTTAYPTDTDGWIAATFTAGVFRGTFSSTRLRPTHATKTDPPMIAQRRSTPAGTAGASAASFQRVSNQPISNRARV